MASTFGFDFSNPKIGNATFGDIGGAVSDLYAAEGDKYKAQGAEIEAGQYREAADFAQQNVGFTETSTAIKEAQQQREATMAIGRTTNAVAGAGFAASGSALDLLRDSASQAALTRQVMGYQGLITEAGYQEQEKALTSQAQAADVAAQAANEAAKGADISAAIKGVAAVASLFGA